MQQLRNPQDLIFKKPGEHEMQHLTSDEEQDTAG